MLRSLISVSRRGVLFCAAAAAIVAAIFVLPLQRHSKASSGDFVVTKSHDASLPNYDIRTDKSAVEKMAALRISGRKSAVEIANVRDTMARGEAALKQTVPTLVVEYNSDLHIPEVIAPDIKLGREFLTAPSGLKRSDVLKNFLRQNTELLGAQSSDIDSLHVAADYTNPDGNLSYVELDQTVDGIPVFRGEIKAGFTTSGEIIRVINNFAPGLSPKSLSMDFGDPAAAVSIAAEYINADLSSIDSARSQKKSTDLKVAFGDGDWAPTAEKMYFPTEPGVAVPAWRVLIWQPVSAYYVIVDAQSGALLWRKNITEDQTQAATYNVFSNPDSLINIAHSPFPFSPGPSTPNGLQAAGVSRTLVTRVGNEVPYTFNQLGWLPDGANTTDGNNVQAGLDRELPNANPSNAGDIDPNSIPSGNPNRVFDFPAVPGIPTNPALHGGQSPLPAGQFAGACQALGTATAPTDFQKASVTQLFYTVNRYHDEMYLLGFTEAARNFQNVNFTGQGLGGDRVSAQSQDCGGVNNANFGTPADGARPSMQMYLFTGPSPNIDGSFDADVVIHEHTHGLSNRLHGNGSGLFNDMSRGMGEGWSDFYGMSLLSQPSDPIDGVYTTGAYVTYSLNGGFNNAYYGIRRFPTAIKTAVGGPNNRPHDPLTFADIDSNQQNLNDGAYGPRTSGNADEVHNAGEIWCTMLWEIRARMVARLGWSVGNRKAMQLIMDGMKLAPLSPTYLSERDAIVAAAVASGTEEDVADIWAGFAARGLGANAQILNVGGTSVGGTGTTHVIEAFDLPNLSQTGPITVDDSIGDNDGYPEPGESVMLSVPLNNSTGRTANNVSLQIVSDGATANYGTITGIATRGVPFLYKIPNGTTCGTNLTITMNVTSSFGPLQFTRTVFVGRPSTTVSTENFDSLTAPQIPNNWTSEPTNSANRFITTTNTTDSVPNAVYARDPTSVGGGTDLTAPPISVTSASATMSFRHLYNTELGWDGGVIDISIAGGPFQDIVTAGGSFVQNGYNDALGAGVNNPVGNRAAWTGNSGGYVTTVVQFPASANGKVVVLKWRFGADDNTAGSGANPGWYIDTISLSNAGFTTSFSCTLNIGPVKVSGKVTAPDGSGLKNATVFIFGSAGTSGFSRRVTTNSFGLYTIDQVPPLDTYTLGVTSKRYRFTSKNIQLTGDFTNADFAGVE